MHAILTQSLAVSETTDGLYNPFVLPAVQRSGYVQSLTSGYSDDSAPDYRARRVADAGELQLTTSSVSIPFNTALDLGGIGKGYAADQLATLLDKHQPRGYWIDLSGDIALFGYDENNQPLSVAVQGSNLQITANGTRIGIATSGTQRRHASGTHHIIDPRTGQSAATNLQLATILAADTTTVDTLASIALILGKDAAPDWLASQGVYGWILQSAQETISSTLTTAITIREGIYAS